MSYRGNPARSSTCNFKGIFNFRDLGNHTTLDGRRVKTGSVFRCGMSTSTSEDISSLETLGVKTIIDLRSQDEQPEFKSLIGNRFKHEVYNLLPHSAALIGSFRRTTLFVKIKLILMMLLCLWNRAFLNLYKIFMENEVGWYYEIIVDKSHDSVRRIFETILDSANDSKPIVVCCSLGKDRTGFVCAVLLRALGVPVKDVIADYTLSEAAEPQMRALLKQQLGQLGIKCPPHTALPNPASVERFLSKIDKQHGSIEGYLRDIGFSPESLRMLRESLLE